MNVADFHSALAEPIRRFVEYKRALNRKYRPEVAALRLFDRYLCEHAAAGWNSIDSILIERFLQSRPRARPRSYNHLLGVIHRFFDWAVVQQLAASNPVISARRRDTGKRIPYLFDLSDARRLLEVAGTLPDRSRAPHRARTYGTIFALLYGLGLRVGEAVRLKLGMLISTATRCLFARRNSVRAGLCRWAPGWRRASDVNIEERHGEAREADRALFSFTKRGCICPETVSQTFHALVPKLGLRLPPGVSPPRLHDLRHAFAVGTLLRWYREGIDPNCRLIHLSTFLGHVDPNSTAVYLTITDELLREADRRFRAFAPTGGDR
jgi:site-specific recombinase XerD